jgi:spore maturation protein CgeB
MRVVLFYHSLISDWNHGNAHFLRGIARELLARGHEVRVWEPSDAWSVQQLVADAGPEAIEAFHRAFPRLDSVRYDREAILTSGLDDALAGADLVLVHEWNEPRLVAEIGRRRAIRDDFALLFHDTHHRSLSEPRSIAALDLSAYDGVLAFGDVVRRRYLEQRWARRAWTWHEAADTRLFRPLDPDGGERGDLVWIGNWGDEERSRELGEFLLGPVRRLGLDAAVHGVRYPAAARRALAAAGVDYRGWLPNFEVPRVFARYALTVHVPRRPYVELLPGIPTIRPFEALACGIPLVCSPWHDAEGLFRPGVDYLVAEDGAAMERLLHELLADPERRAELAASGLETILGRHTCRHRVAELIDVAVELGVDPRPAATHGAAPGEERATPPVAAPRRPARRVEEQCGIAALRRASA